MENFARRVLWVGITLIICCLVDPNIRNWGLIFLIANVAGYVEGRTHDR